MKTRLIAGTLALALPSYATAQEANLSFGATVASEYVSSGIRYSDGIALQPYAELGFGSLYAGAYMSNLSPDLTGANTETGLSLGYRGGEGVFTYDLSVAYYMYSEAFADFPVEDYAEAIFSGTLAATETLYLTGDIALAPEYDQTNLTLTVDYYTAVEGLSVGASIGRLDADYGDWTYWSAGGFYQMSDTVGLSLAYHDGNVDPAIGLLGADGLIVATATFGFSLR